VDEWYVDDLGEEQQNVQEFVEGSKDGGIGGGV